MTIRARLVVGLGLVGTVLGVVCVVAVLRMRTMAAELRELALRRVPGIVAVSDVVGQVNASSQALRTLVVSDLRAERASASAAMLEANRKVGRGLDRLERTASERGRSLLRDASTARAAYFAATDGIRRRALARPPHSEENGASCAGCHGGGKQGDGGFKGMLALQARYTGALEALVRHEGAAVDAQGQAMERSHASALVVVALLSLLGALCAIAAAVWLVRATTRPLRRCAEVAERVATGDTAVVIEADRRDEAGALMTAMGDMVARLRGLIGDMAAMAEQHDAGEIDAVLDESRYQGAFREMARRVNGMVGSQIAANRKAMACVGELGKGNFEVALERFPGKMGCARTSRRSPPRCGRSRLPRGRARSSLAASQGASLGTGASSCRA